MYGERQGELCPDLHVFSPMLSLLLLLMMMLLLKKSIVLNDAGEQLTLPAFDPMMFRTRIRKTVRNTSNLVLPSSGLIIIDHQLWSCFKTNKYNRLDAGHLDCFIR